MQGLQRSERKVGPTADEAELEYISALHQSCLPNLRMDGTISSSDIAVLLNSRYGIVISSEVAKDIAFNLCGAKAKTYNQDSLEKTSIFARFKDFKPPGLLQKKEKFSNEESEDKNLKENEVSEEDSDKKDDEDIYFDLVQVLALLLIPNILDYTENEKMTVFEHSLDSLLEPLKDSVEEKFRETVQMDLDMLRSLLLSAGDFDSSNDEELMEKMLKLYEENDSCIYKSFAHCLTSDVREGYDADVSDSNNEKPSTFYDVFGCNWERATHTWASFKKVPTFTFIDYPNQSFNSVTYNTVVWAFYIFSVLYYWIGIGQSELIGRSTNFNCSGYGCSIAEKVISWSLTGATVGSFGLCFLVMNGFGNVAANNRRTFWSMITVLLFLAPFAFLMKYWEDTPHDVITNTTYFNICPPSWIKNQRVEKTGAIPIVFESSCYPFRSLCKNHLELQGKRLVSDFFKLTFEEDERCGESGLAYGLFGFGHQCANGVCGNESVNSLCDSDKNCSLSNYQGACGYEKDVNNTLLSPPQEKICCPSGQYTLTQNGPVCTKQAPGTPCTDDLVCESGMCTGGLCKHTSNYLGISSNCSAHEECLSGFCNPITRVCTTEWWFCPTYTENLQTFSETEQILYRVLFNSLEIPPVCTSRELFCEKNNGLTKALALKAFGCECDCIIDKLAEIKVIELKNDTDPTIQSQTSTFEFLDNIELSLRNEPFLLCLLCSGIIGVFVLCTQLYVIFTNSDKRTRDFESKCAADFKTNKLVENALETHQCHGSDIQLEGSTMRNYFKGLHKKESIGGLFWVISKLRSRELSMNEGIHLSPRIYIANMVQIAILIVLVVVVSLGIHETAEAFDRFIFQNSPLTKEDVEKMSYEEFYNMDLRRRLTAFVQNPIVDRFPRGWMVRSAGTPALIFSAFVGLFSIVIYIPSYVNTTLKMRSGIISTFHDPQFLSIRRSSDQVSLNLGNIIFSQVGACVLSLVFAYFATFVFIFPYTRETAISVVFTVIGILVSTIVKTALQTICRSNFFCALYRKNVLGANLSNLFFECWYIATATLTIVKRIVTIFTKLLVGISRADIAFMHPDVGIEKTASSFRCEIFVNEAHCHPYLDRLSGIYLRRLRDGDKFGSRVGQAWRSLFIIGLCPWMIKKQVNVLLDLDLELKDEDEEMMKK